MFQEYQILAMTLYVKSNNSLLKWMQSSSHVSETFLKYIFLSIFYFIKGNFLLKKKQNRMPLFKKLLYVEISFKFSLFIFKAISKLTQVLYMKVI